MSVEDNVGTLEGLLETIDSAITGASGSGEIGGDVLTGLNGVTGDATPEKLEEAKSAISEANHKLEEAVGAFGTAAEAINAYISTIS
jgi:hypothetical protein